MKIVYFGCDLFFECFEYFVNSPDLEVVALHSFRSPHPLDSSDKVSALAKEKGIPVIFGKPDSETVKAYFCGGVDFIFSAGYAYKIPVNVCDNFRGVNLHPALLPVGRGPWPYPVTILKGLNKTGVTFHKLEESFDTGDIILQEEYDLLPEDTVDTLIMRSKNYALKLLPKLIGDFDNLWENALPQGKGEFWDEPTPDTRVISDDLTVEQAKRRIRAYGKEGVIYNGLVYSGKGMPIKISLSDGEIYLS